jgi:glycosyltransferase involved in cell wall biosynthesis
LFGKSKVMNIAIIGDDSLPKSTLVHAKMLHELACELKRAGHHPVLIAPGSPEQVKKLNKTDIQGIEYWKFKSGKLRGQGKFKRAINESLLSYKAWTAIKPELKQINFDLVIYYSPSIFFGSLVRNIKKACSASSYLVLRDNFPQWAVDEGLIPENSLIEKYFRYFERMNYEAADRIGLMSPKNQEIFNIQTHNKYETEILFNWADLAKHETSNFNLRAKLRLTNEVIFFYGGNIGHAQDMSNLLRLAHSMRSESNAHFILLGQGDEVVLVKDTIDAKRMNNISFMPSVSQDEYKAILKEVDVGLFSLAASHKSHNFPGKLLGYMHAGIPILGSVNFGNDLIEIVTENNAGFVFVNGDDQSFFDTAEKLAKDSTLRTSIGKQGTTLLENVFSVQSAASTILTK